MPDDQINNASDSQNDQLGSNDNAKTLEDWQKLAIAREKRLKETEEKLQFVSSAKGSLEDRIKAIEQAQKDKLEKDGDYKALADKHAADVEKYKPLAERASTLEAIIRESNEARIKNVPDSMKALIPSDYAPEKLQTWLNANEALLVKPPAPDYDGGKGGNGSAPPNIKLSPDEKAMAKRMGVTEEDYMKVKARREK